MFGINMGLFQTHEMQGPLGWTKGGGGKHNGASREFHALLWG